jgi:hypothetical protein
MHDGLCKKRNLVLFRAFGFVFFFLHRPLSTPFLGEFWRAVRTHVDSHYTKNYYFLFGLLFVSILLSIHEQMSWGAETPCPVRSTFSLRFR